MTARTSFAVLTAAFLITAGACWAAVPQSLSYQGYLTDRIGSPIMDSQTITFAIYTVPVSGVPVWQETKSVAFANGLFSVQLGDLAAFPPDLFDVPLWLGMTIGTDSEMEPRRPLTTAGFSFRAEDADGLQGRTAAELDQSFHVDDDANPHGVTAVQTGAATAVALDAHAINAANPHSVSVSQTGGTSAATFGSHAAETAAHHARYADAEAVGAMGIQSESNSLNHARYANAEAVSAVIAADGDGSGLDADLVDGLQATEIINAAAGAVGGTRYEFVGFSDDSLGNFGLAENTAGLLDMTNACKATFGPTAKFATSAEVLATTTFTQQSGFAWLQPVIVAGDSSNLVDISGQSAGSCSGWGTSSGGGLALTDKIRIITKQCVDFWKVACSLPASTTR